MHVQAIYQGGAKIAFSESAFFPRFSQPGFIQALRALFGYNFNQNFFPPAITSLTISSFLAADTSCRAGKNQL